MTRLDTRVSRTEGTATLHPVINPDGSTGGWADARTRFEGETYISPAVTLVGPMTLTNCSLGNADLIEPLTIITTDRSTLEDLVWEGLDASKVTAQSINLKDVQFFGTVELATDSALRLKKARLSDTAITTAHPVIITDSTLNTITIEGLGEVYINESTLLNGIYRNAGELNIMGTLFDSINLRTEEARASFLRQTCRRDLMWADEELTLTEYDVLVHHRTPFFKHNLSTLVNRSTGTITFLSEIDLWSLEGFEAEVQERDLSIENREVTETEYTYIETLIAQAKLFTQL